MGVSTSPDAQSMYTIIHYTLSQLFKPIKYAAIVSYQIFAEYVDKSSHRKAVTTKK